MAKTHTPGPWRVLTPGRPLEGFLCAVDSPIGAVAWALAPLDDAAVGAANAALIAAAPDLLAALTRIVADWDAVGEMLQVPDEINVTDHWDAARAAIAKATNQGA